jgi:hypothetical protein
MDEIKIQLENSEEKVTGDIKTQLEIGKEKITDVIEDSVLDPLKEKTETIKSNLDALQ